MGEPNWYSRPCVAGMPVYTLLLFSLIAQNLPDPGYRPRDTTTVTLF